MKEVQEVAQQLGDHCELTALVVNDACPQESWREIAPHPQVEVLHHAENRGMGLTRSQAWRRLLNTTAQQ